MFGRKKRGALIHEVDESRYVVNDFALRGPFWSYRNCEYTPDPSYEESVMLPVLDEHIRLLCSGAIDAGNKDVLVQLILEGALKAVKFQQKRRINHADTNCQFVIRRKADMEDLEAILEDEQKEEEELLREMKHIDKMLAKDGMGVKDDDEEGN